MNKKRSHVEVTGSGNGPKLADIKSKAAMLRAQLKPLADELTDAYQASIHVAQGDSIEYEGANLGFEDSSDIVYSPEAVEHHTVAVGYDALTREFLVRFNHWPYEEYDAYALDYNHVKRYSSCTSEATAIIEHARDIASSGQWNKDLPADGKITKVTDGISLDSKDITQTYRSASLPALLGYLNAKVFKSESQVDASKYATLSEALQPANGAALS